MGGGGGAHHQGALVYSPEASCVSKIPTQYCGYTHG